MYAWLISMALAEPTTDEVISTVESSDNLDEVEQSEARAGVPVQIQLHNGVILTGTVPLQQLVFWSPTSIDVLQFTMNGETVELQSNQIASIQQIEVAAVPSETSPLVSESMSVVETDVIEVESDKPPSPILNANGFSFTNPAASRYLYAPSSIGLQAGQGYISQKLLFTSGVYALTDNATILVGTLVPIPLVSVLGAKVSQKIEPDLHVSVGVESFFLPFSGLMGDGSISVPVTIGYAGVTKGDLDSHISVSTGVIYETIFSNGNFIYPIMVSGHHRMSDRLAIVSENWMMLNTDKIQDGLSPYLASISSIAFRLIGQRDSTMQIFGQMISDNGYPRYTWDIGLIMLHGAQSESLTDPITGEVYYSKYSSSYGFGPFPWIDYTWHFGPARIEKSEEEQ